MLQHSVLDFFQLLTSDHLVDLKFYPICSDDCDRTLFWVVLCETTLRFLNWHEVCQPDSVNGDGSATLLVNELIV